MEMNFVKRDSPRATSYKLQAPGYEQTCSMLVAHGFKLIMGVIFLFTLLGSPLAAHGSWLTDSLRIETINGKQFIIHQVDPKETLYAISRRYGVPVAALIENNPKSDAGLSVGQELKVPYIPKGKKGKDNGIHKVVVKETLFSIAKLYAVSVDDLKNWNGLKDNAIDVGQELIVRKKSVAKEGETKELTMTPPMKMLRGTHTVMNKETLFSISKMYGATIPQLKSWNNLTTDEVKPGQTIFVLPPMSIPEKSQPNLATAATEPVKPSSPEIKISESVAGADEIRERGTAEIMEGTDGNRKYLALHKTAKVGTIMKVRNEATNLEVFVRVVAALGADQPGVIKISKSAYNKLAATEPKFNVELIYYK